MGVGKQKIQRLMTTVSFRLTGKMRLLHALKVRRVKSGRSSKARTDLRRFVLVLDKLIVKLVMHGHCVPMQKLIPDKWFCVHGNSMRPFKLEELNKPPNSSRNDMPSVLVLKVLFRKELELLIFVLPVTVDWIKRISNIFLLLLP